MPIELTKIIEWLATVGISGAAGAGLVLWFTQTWVTERIKGQVKAEYDGQLEILKAKLKSEADVEIEKLKAQLSIAAAERHVRFARLHEKRAEVIANVYAALRDALFAMAAYVNLIQMRGGTPLSELGKVAAEKAQKFRELYHSQRIFIPKDTAAKLDNVNREIVQSFNVFQFMVDTPPGGNPPDHTAWKQTYDKIDHLSKAALEDLETDFRRLLAGEE